MQTPQYPLPTLGRMMVFVDGENLVSRYQAMLDDGWSAHKEGVTHERDVLVWEPNSVLVGLHVVLRATYYTYVQGSDKGVSDVAAKIKALTFRNYTQPGLNFGQLPNSLTPCVFSKLKNRRAKGVDIQLTVDILTHAYQNNCDTIYLMSGDGDYVPVLAEVQRLGKQVFISAFSSGLSPRLRQMADSFQCLDAYYLQEAREGRVPEAVTRPTSQERLVIEGVSSPD